MTARVGLVDQFELGNPVVASSGRLVVLTSRALIGTRHAARIQLSIQDSVVRGLALAIDEHNCMLVLRFPQNIPIPNSNSIVKCLMVADVANLSLDRAKVRLQKLLSDSAVLDKLSSRGARHAMLFVLEAQDPTLRAARMTLLRTSLTQPQGRD